MSTRLTAPLALATAVALAAAPAMADPVVTPYVAFGAGLNALQKQTISGVATRFGQQPGGYIDAEPGYALMGSFGLSFRGGLRAEVEGNFSQNEFKQATAGALKDVTANGREKANSLYANFLYDFNLSALNISVVPYLGGGVGYSWTTWSNVNAFNLNERAWHMDNDGALTYQVIAGLAIPVSFIKNLSLTADYRLRLTEGRNYNGRILYSRFGSFPIQTQTDRETTHNFMVGVRYHFGG